MPDLSLVLDDELWQEICRRYDACVLGTCRNLNGREEAIQVSYHGGKLTCIGMAAHIEDKILENMRGRSSVEPE